MPGHDRNVRTEAIIENILQGPGVRERFGCDLAFVLRLHRVARELSRAVDTTIRPGEALSMRSPREAIR